MIVTLFWGGVSYIAGIVSVITAFWWWLNYHEEEKLLDDRPSITQSSLPSALNKTLNSSEGYQRRETCFALNLILQFFYQVS